MRSRRLAVLVVAGVTVAGLVTTGATTPSRAAAPTWQRDASGLMVFEGEFREPGVVPASADAALGAADALLEMAPEDFAGAWFDHATGKVVLATASARGATVLASLRRGSVPTTSLVAKASRANPAVAAVLAEDARTRLPGLGKALASGLAVERTVPRDHRDLTRVKDEAIDLTGAGKAAGRIWMTRLDLPRNRVIVTVDKLTTALASRIVQRWGTDVVAVEVAEDTSPMQLTVGRQNDQSPFYGGSKMGHPGCTDAFSFYLGSVDYMLTAGHCYPEGGPAGTTVSAMGTVIERSRENFDDGVGTVRLTGQSVYRGDLALVQVTSGRSSYGRIYRGDSKSLTSARVVGMFSRASRPGDQFCTGSATNKSDGAAGPGEVCGWTVDVAGVDYRLSSGETIRNFIRSKRKTGWCIRPGDSGSPAYIVSSGNVGAKGVANSGGGGGSDYYGGALDPCTVGMTDIWHAPYAWGVSLTTS